MNNRLTIQDLDPVRVPSELISQPYGTFTVRSFKPNDQIITQIQVNREKYSDIPARSNVILSVRVNESLHKHTVLHYRLFLPAIDGQVDQSHLLEQYNRLKDNLSSDKFTPLKKELLVRITDNNIWHFDQNNIQQLKRLNAQSDGQHNAGILMAKCNYPNGIKVEFIIKRCNDDSRFNREFDLLKELCFCHIVTFYGQFSESNSKYLVLAHGGISLASVSFSPLNIDRVANYGFQITNGMIYLEKKNIIHRDLTVSNILIDKYGLVRIADFGHAIRKDPEQKTFQATKYDLELTFCLDICAPECMPSPPINGKRTTDSTLETLHRNFSFKSDVWAFGILLVQLLIGQQSKLYPYWTKDYDLIHQIKENRRYPERPSNCPIDMYTILEQCWTYKPDDRISFFNVRRELQKFLGF